MSPITVPKSLRKLTQLSFLLVYIIEEFTRNKRFCTWSCFERESFWNSCLKWPIDQNIFIPTKMNKGFLFLLHMSLQYKCSFHESGIMWEINISYIVCVPAQFMQNAKRKFPCMIHEFRTCSTQVKWWKPTTQMNLTTTRKQSKEQETDLIHCSSFSWQDWFCWFRYWHRGARRAWHTLWHWR